MSVDETDPLSLRPLQQHWNAIASVSAEEWASLIESARETRACSRKPCQHAFLENLDSLLT